MNDAPEGRLNPSLHVNYKASADHKGHIGHFPTLFAEWQMNGALSFGSARIWENAILSSGGSLPLFGDQTQRRM